MKTVFSVLAILITLGVAGAEEKLNAENAGKLAVIREKVAAIKASKGILYSISKELPEISKEPNVSGYPILSEVALESKESDEILALLLKDDSYMNARTSCFTPGMALKFDNGDKPISILVCLHCLAIHWYVGDNHTNLVLSKKGRDALQSIYDDHFSSKR